MGTCFCWRNGRIDFARRAPRNALPLARGPLRELRKITLAIARHAYDGDYLLVPGIPEADGDAAALDAAIRFSDAVKKRMKHPPMFGEAGAP